MWNAGSPGPRCTLDGHLGRVDTREARARYRGDGHASSPREHAVQGGVVYPGRLPCRAIEFSDPRSSSASLLARAREAFSDLEILRSTRSSDRYHSREQRPQVLSMSCAGESRNASPIRSFKLLEHVLSIMCGKYHCQRTNFGRRSSIVHPPLTCPQGRSRQRIKSLKNRIKSMGTGDAKV